MHDHFSLLARSSYVSAQSAIGQQLTARASTCSSLPTSVGIRPYVPRRHRRLLVEPPSLTESPQDAAPSEVLPSGLLPHPPYRYSLYRAGSHTRSGKGGDLMTTLRARVGAGSMLVLLGFVVFVPFGWALVLYYYVAQSPSAKPIKKISGLGGAYTVEIGKSR